MVPLTTSAARPAPEPAGSARAISEDVMLGEKYWSFQ
jgi:hypothetical protein